MAVKTVEMVRKIRDKHYEETKNLPVEEQIKAVKKKSEKLQEELKTLHRPTSPATEN
jgi:hypothetical protein